MNIRPQRGFLPRSKEAFVPHEASMANARGGGRAADTWARRGCGCCTGAVFGRWEGRRLRAFSAGRFPPAAAVGAGPSEPMDCLPGPRAAPELHPQAG